MTENLTPAGSRVVVDRHGDDITLRVPPVGMLHPGGTGTYSCLGLSFLFGSAVATAAFAAAWFWEVKGARDMWPVFLILPVFWLAAVGLLLLAINMGRRRAALAVVGEKLLVIQTGLFGSTRKEWRRDQIEDIRTGPSRVSIEGHGPVLALQIYARQGGQFGILTGHPEAELEWIATMLRRALRRAPESDEGTNEREPDSSRSSSIG